ncbi:hypothetical protein ABTY96_45465 [Streptomyces sp. NPDC096057]|uniref:hypothetical protein n=1 Tax=Streptomyces sp. NPDC096057 TaxID=3155543 RepID=UPI0033277B9A
MADHGRVEWVRARTGGSGPGGPATSCSRPPGAHTVHADSAPAEETAEADFRGPPEAGGVS